MNRISDSRYMDLALALARGQQGRTAPNPAVGCVITDKSGIVATGATADRGRPHAERVALDAAGDRAAGATVYVTLEPCAFHGQTPPCADALVAAKVGRVVIACLDDHPQVDGAGIERLREAGITVETGLRESEARDLYEGFFSRIHAGRPAVYLDDRAPRYDAELSIKPGEDIDTALERLGAEGVNRIFVRPGSEAAAKLLAAGQAKTACHTGHTEY